MSADKSPPTAALAPASRWQSGWAFGGLAAIFVLVSLASSRHQVSTVEMNRNDAACYMILARNIAQRGVYSLEQAEPFHPHTEWPPGIPLLYVPPMAIVGEFPLDATGTAVIHAWSLLLAVLSLWMVWRYLKEMTSPIGALCATAAVASTKAFLDSANAATADAVAVGFAFLALREIEVYFRDKTPSRSGEAVEQTARLSVGRKKKAKKTTVRKSPTAPKIAKPRRLRAVGLHVLLACLPIVKPYLGLVFVAYLWKLLETRPQWRQRLLGTVAIGACCLPFVGFMAFSVIAAERQGTISAVTWLTTDNPTAVLEGVASTDQKTLGEWLRGGLRTIRFFLLDNVSEAGVPALRWFGFSDWPRVARFGTLALVFGTLACGLVRAVRQKQIAGVGYSTAMFAFFVVFACDSPRYFTVLTPMCALYFWNGLTELLAMFGSRSARTVVGRALVPVSEKKEGQACSPFDPQAVATGFVLSVAVIAAGSWVEHRFSERVDPELFYREVYAALRAAQVDESIHAIAVPYQLRSVATVETSKPVLSWDECVSSQRHQWSRTAVLVIEQDSTGRFTRPLPTELAGVGSDAERLIAGRHVRLRIHAGRP